MISIAEACRMLGRSERSVRSYLACRKLHGERLGKAWRVDVGSVEALRGQLAGHTTEIPAQLPVVAPPPVAPSPTSGPNVARTGAGVPPDDLPRPPRPERRNRTARPVTTLSAWETTIPIVAATLKALRPAQSDNDRDELAVRARRLAADGASLLAAGFHAFHRTDKASRYVGARDALSECAGALRVLAEIGGGHPVGLRDIADRLEAEAIPALGGLVRAMERKTADGGPRTAEVGPPTAGDGRHAADEDKRAHEG
ncbi:MAG: helix-turn-helix domain-containing protein [Myxococcota bacterium]|nr:helix-turn-helix domain-containing protein [Myxococcota bacterium]